MEKKTSIVVESKWRNLERYRNSWQYTIPLPSTLRNVVCLELVEASIPNTQQTIHNFNNTFQLVPDGGQVITVSIPTGIYEPPILLDTIASALNDKGAVNAQLSYATDTNLVTIQCDALFSLPFGSGTGVDTSIHRHLGFTNRDINQVLSISSPYAMNIPPPPYVLVDCVEVPADVKNRSSVPQRDVPAVFNTHPELMPLPYLGLVFLDTDYLTWKIWRGQSEQVQCQRFLPTDIRQLSITIHDDKGSFYDANGYDHTLVFQATQLVPEPIPSMCPGNNRLPGPSPWGMNCRVPYC